MTFMADFEVREVAQELLAQQGAPASAENMTRAMNAIIADPNVARATPTGNDLYVTRVEQRLAPSTDRYGPGEGDASFAAGLNLTGESADAAASASPPATGTGAAAVRSGSSDGSVQQVPQRSGSGTGSGDVRGRTDVSLPRNGAGSAGAVQTDARTLPTDIPTIPGTAIADTQIDNAQDGMGLLELLLGGGAAAAGGVAGANMLMRRGGGTPSPAPAPTQLQPSDVVRGQADAFAPTQLDLFGEGVQPSSQVTPDANASPAPVSDPRQMDLFNQQQSLDLSQQGTPARTFALNEQGIHVTPDGRPVAFNADDPRATPEQVEALRRHMAGGGAGTTENAIADAVIAAETSAPALTATGADMGPDVPVPPEATPESVAANEREQMNRKNDMQRRVAQRMLNEALGENALEVDFDGNTYRVLAPGPDGSPVLVGNYRNANMLRNDLGRIRSDIANGKITARSPELRGGTPPSMDEPVDLPGSKEEMDLVGESSNVSDESLAHVEDIKKYEQALKERIAAGEGSRTENMKELRKVQEALKRLASTIR